MAKFIYKARQRKEGGLVRGTMEGDNEQEVAQYLLEKNCIILSIRKAVWYEELLVKKPYKLKEKEIILLCKELAIMLNAGLDLVQALLLLGESKGKWGKFLQYTLAQLKEGNSLSEVWARESFLPAYLISCIKVAEHTGLLGEAFNQGAKYLEQQRLQKERLRQITAYPILLLLMLNIIVGIMLWQIVPTFKEVFQSMNIEVPLLTKFLFMLSDMALAIPFNIILPVIVVFLIISWPWQKLGILLMKIIKVIPYFNIWLERFWLMNFGSELLLLYNAGIPLEENLLILQDNTKNKYYQHRLKVIRQALSQGKTLYEACEAAGIRESFFLQLIKVGEETGGLGEALGYSNSFLAEEIKEFLNRLMILLEPCLILMVGLLVGFFIFALIVPLFSIPNAIGV